MSEKDNNLDDKNTDAGSESKDSNMTTVEFSSKLSLSYINYAAFVITHRAIPSIYDGFKDGQRRIIYVLYDFHKSSDNRFIKCARIVGNVSGKFHPHGEVSIYDSLVRMGQSFSMVLPMVDSQGNFGSVDGDSPAAQRYTEAKLSKAGSLLLDDINLCPMRKNYDGSEMEPVHFVIKYPVVLINGNSGIGVVVTSCIPSHNPNEIFNALIYMLEAEDYTVITYSDIKKYIQGPDLPNYCIIDSFNLDNVYTTGKGAIVTSSEVTYSESKHEIIIRGLAYGVKKLNLIKSIVESMKERIVTGITDIIDDSKDTDYRLRITLEPNINGHVIVRRLQKYTMCSNSIGSSFRFVVDGKPVIFPLISILSSFITKRIESVKEKIRLDSVAKIASIERIIALFVAHKTSSTLNIIDKILSSDDVVQARLQLTEMTFDISEIHSLLPTNMQKIDIKNFKLTPLQIEYLLNTQIIKLNKQKVKNLEEIISENTKKITANELLLLDERNIKNFIIQELQSILKHVSKERLCTIKLLDKRLRLEDMEPEKDIVLFVSSKNVITHYNTSVLRTQKRGGKGRILFESKDISSLIMTTTHEDILLFTELGFGYKVNVFDFYYREKALVEIISLRPGDKIISMKVFNCEQKYDSVIILTAKGLIKKHSTSDFKFFNKLGKIICLLSEGDRIIKVEFVYKQDYCVLFAKSGRFICLDNNELREFVSRKTKGIKGMKLKEDDSIKEVVGISKYDANTNTDTNTDVNTDTNTINNKTSILIIDAVGNAKKLSSDTFLDRISNRNTLGVSCINKKYGFLAACVKLTSNFNRIIIVTNSGKIMIINFDEIPDAKRLNKGIKLVNLNKNDFIIFAHTI